MKNLTFLFLILFFCCNADAQDSRRTVRSSRRTEESKTTETDWFMEISMRSDGMPLREFFDGLSKNYRFSYFLDRRVDPRRLLTFSVERTPLAAAIQELVRQNELSFCLYDSVLYIGPPDASGELLTSIALFRQEIAEQKSVVQQRLLKSVPLKTNDFSNPRDVLEQIARSANCRWKSLDKMPFDCWNGLKISALAVADQAAFVLIGFDVRPSTSDSDENVLEPKSLNSEVARLFPAADVSTDCEKDFPECRFQAATDSFGEAKIEVRGSFRDVARLEYRLAEKRMNAALAAETSRRNDARSATNGEEPDKRNGKIVQITAEIKNKTLANVFDALEPELGTSFAIDSSLQQKGVSLQTRISCNFKNATREKILNQIAREIGAKFRYEEGRVLFYAR